MQLSPARFISIAGTEVHAAVENAADGKIALKEIKQKKNEFQLERRALVHQQKIAAKAAARARKAQTAKQTGVVAFVRRMFAKKASAKTGPSLAEIEAQITSIDEILFNLDSCKVQIEGKLLQLG